jgi:hypothetical protein
LRRSRSAEAQTSRILYQPSDFGGAMRGVGSGGALARTCAARPQVCAYAGAETPGAADRIARSAFQPILLPDSGASLAEEGSPAERVNWAAALPRVPFSG